MSAATQFHVQEEETAILPKTRQALTTERLEQLSEEFQAARG